MKQQNIVLNRDTSKRHAKRLFKVLKEELNLPENFKLAQSQEILAKSLGFNNWHELDTAFKENESIQTLAQNNEDLNAIAAIVTHKLSLTDKDSFTYEVFDYSGGTEKINRIIIPYEKLFSQYHIMPYLLALLTHESAELKDYIHKNLVINYEDSAYNDARYNMNDNQYNIAFRDNNPLMLEKIALAIVELFELALNKKNREKREFNFSRLQDCFWPTDELLQEVSRKTGQSAPTLQSEQSYILHTQIKRSFISYLDEYELTTILVQLAGPDTQQLLDPIIKCLYYMHAQKEIIMDMNALHEYLILENITKLYKVRRDFPMELRVGLRRYLTSLPGFQDTAPRQEEETLKKHAELQMKLVNPLNALKSIEREDVLIFDPRWWEFLGLDLQIPAFIKNVTPGVQNYFKGNEYETEFWFNLFDIQGPMKGNVGPYRKFSFLFKSHKTVWLSDLVKSLYDLSLNSEEHFTARKFILAYPRIKKISKELQRVYLENRK